MGNASNKTVSFAEKSTQVLTAIRKTLEGPLSSLIENSLDFFKDNVNFDFNIKNKIAIFWDYENIPIPKKFDPSLFFESLFTFEDKSKIVTRQVFGDEEAISSKLNVIEDIGFTFKPHIATGKGGEADFNLTANCAKYLTAENKHLHFLLLLGDMDYVQLIQNIILENHSVEIVCLDKKSVSPLLKDRVQRIRDTKDIEDQMKILLSTRISESTDEQQTRTSYNQLQKLIPDKKKMKSILSDISNRAKNPQINEFLKKELNIIQGQLGAAQEKISKFSKDVKEKLKCPYCKKYYLTQKLMEKHILENHKKFKCEFCDKRFTSIEGKKQHEKEIH